MLLKLFTNLNNFSKFELNEALDKNLQIELILFNSNIKRI